MNIICSLFSILILVFDDEVETALVLEVEAIQYCCYRKGNLFHEKYYLYNPFRTIL
jgi:hypothetical protein